MQNNKTTCKPIECLNDVLEWNGDNKRKYIIRNLKLSKKEDEEDGSNKKMKIILCHDMKNNYLVLTHTLYG